MIYSTYFDAKVCFWWYLLSLLIGLFFFQMKLKQPITPTFQKNQATSKTYHGMYHKKIKFKTLLHERKKKEREKFQHSTQRFCFYWFLVHDQCENKYGYRVPAEAGLASGRTTAYFRADLLHSLPASNQLLAALLPLSSFKHSTLTDWMITLNNNP